MKANCKCGRIFCKEFALSTSHISSLFRETIHGAFLNLAPINAAKNGLQFILNNKFDGRIFRYQMEGVYCRVHSLLLDVLVDGEFVPR